MDASVFAKMLSDKSITDLKKLSYKYPGIDMSEFIALLKAGTYKALPLLDFHGENLFYMRNVTQVRMSAIKLLLASRSKEAFGMNAMEDEISSTLTIESIDFSRDSVRKIMSGYAPSDESENRIYGLKKGLEFIADSANTITEDNIHRLYEISIEPYLSEGDKLLPGAFYRHDNVYIVGQDLEHTGLPHGKLPEYIQALAAFINAESKLDDLCKAAVIHFYIAYLHPWFDGNGRMARLIHMWYLRQKGWPSAMFVPFSSYIERSRKAYYNAYTLCEDNARISRIMDVTPFLEYFITNVYNKLEDSLPKPDTTEAFQAALNSGKITEKESELWSFVLSAYGTNEFSTKQLERDFGNAAYATIRSFVLKFSELHLLHSQKYGNRVKYRIFDTD